jgi:hypothetical protein
MIIISIIPVIVIRIQPVRSCGQRSRRRNAIFPESVRRVQLSKNRTLKQSSLSLCLALSVYIYTQIEEESKFNGSIAGNKLDVGGFYLLKSCSYRTLAWYRTLLWLIGFFDIIFEWWE